MEGSWIENRQINKHQQAFKSQTEPQSCNGCNGCISSGFWATYNGLGEITVCTSCCLTVNMPNIFMGIIGKWCFKMVQTMGFSHCPIFCTNSWWYLTKNHKEWRNMKSHPQMFANHGPKSSKIQKNVGFLSYLDLPPVITHVIFMDVSMIFFPSITWGLPHHGAGDLACHSRSICCWLSSAKSPGLGPRVSGSQGPRVPALGWIKGMDLSIYLSIYIYIYVCVNGSIMIFTCI